MSKDGYNINSMPENFKLPDVPPPNPPAPPMLNSERKELLDTVAALRQDKDAAYAAALRTVNRIILEAPFLTDAERDYLLDKIWSK